MANWQRVNIKVPKRFGPTERVSIAQDVISFIIERTRNGDGINGKPFSGTYSKGYRASAAYKEAGKPKSGKPIDLTLSGEMLDSLQFISERSGQIIVGYPSGDKINGKVEGNRLGSYGGSPNKRLARDFLGISKADLQAIIDKYDAQSE